MGRPDPRGLCLRASLPATRLITRCPHKGQGCHACPLWRPLALLPPGRPLARGHAVVPRLAQRGKGPRAPQQAIPHYLAGGAQFFRRDPSVVAPQGSRGLFPPPLRGPCRALLAPTSQQSPPRAQPVPTWGGALHLAGKAAADTVVVGADIVEAPGGQLAGIMELQGRGRSWGGGPWLPSAHGSPQEAQGTGQEGQETPRGGQKWWLWPANLTPGEAESQFHLHLSNPTGRISAGDLGFA